MGAKLLLLDEPSLGLAPLVVEKIVETIVAIAKSGIRYCWSSRTPRWRWRYRAEVT